MVLCGDHGLWGPHLCPSPSCHLWTCWVTSGKAPLPIGPGFLVLPDNGDGEGLSFSAVLFYSFVPSPRNWAVNLLEGGGVTPGSMLPGSVTLGKLRTLLSLSFLI